MSPREIEQSINRIEIDMYYNSDNITVRLVRIEEKLEDVVTKVDLEMKATELNAELIALTNSTFRWSIGIFTIEAGVFPTELK